MKTLKYKSRNNFVIEVKKLINKKNLNNKNNYSIYFELDNNNYLYFSVNLFNRYIKTEIKFDDFNKNNIFIYNGYFETKYFYSLIEKIALESNIFLKKNNLINKTDDFKIDFGGDIVYRKGEFDF